MANDMTEMLKGLLGDNAEEKIQSVIGALGNSNAPSNESEEIAPVMAQQTNNSPLGSGNLNLENIQYLMRIKDVIDEMGNANDTRSNLLLSLRPYMRKTRQQGIDNAIRILNLSRITGLFRS